jgi:mlo protein
MKKAIFEEQTTKALKIWQQAAKDRRKLRKAGVVVDSSPSGFLSVESTPSRGTSPLHLLHKHRPSSKSDPEGVLSSPRSYQSDIDLSEIEGSTPNRHDSRTQDQAGGNETLIFHSLRLKI